MDECTIKLESKDAILFTCECNTDISKDAEEGEIIEDGINDNTISIDCVNKNAKNNEIKTRTQYYTEFQGYSKKRSDRRYCSKFNMNGSTYFPRYSTYTQQHKEFFNNQRGVKNFPDSYESFNRHTPYQKNTNFLLSKYQNIRSKKKMSSFYRNYCVSQYSSRFTPLNNNFHNQNQNENLAFQQNSFGSRNSQNQCSYLRNRSQNYLFPTSQTYKHEPLSSVMSNLNNGLTQSNDSTNNLQNSNINAEMSTRTLINNTSCVNPALIKKNEESFIKDEVKEEISLKTDSIKNEENLLTNFIKNEKNNDCADMARYLFSNTLSDCSVTISVLRPMSIGDITGIMEKYETRIKEFKWLNDKYQAACITYFNRSIALQVYQQFQEES